VTGHTESCPLCGTRFDAEGKGCRPSCPMARGCSTVCCPGCGYSFPQTSAGLTGKLVSWLKSRQAAP
jgi:hypothetical protein